MSQEEEEEEEEDEEEEEEEEEEEDWYGAYIHAWSFEVIIYCGNRQNDR